MGYKHIRIILLSFTRWNLTLVLSLNYGWAPRKLSWHLSDGCLASPTSAHAHSWSQCSLQEGGKANNKTQIRDILSLKAISDLCGLGLLAIKVKRSGILVFLSSLGRVYDCLPHPTSWILPARSVQLSSMSACPREHVCLPMLPKQEWLPSYLKTPQLYIEIAHWN